MRVSIAERQDVSSVTAADGASHVVAVWQDGAMSTLGERLKEAMTSAKMRQSELARASGVSESAISRFKTGLRGSEIEHDTLAKLAKALDVRARTE